MTFKFHFLWSTSYWLEDSTISAAAALDQLLIIFMKNIYLDCRRWKGKDSELLAVHYRRQILCILHNIDVKI